MSYLLDTNIVSEFYNTKHLPFCQTENPFDSNHPSG
jgi:hypothetical protein